MVTAFLFPGQGSQVQGMLHQLPNHQVVTSTLVEASEVLQLDVIGMDTQVELSSTISVQLSLLISSVAFARVLLSEQGEPSYVAGHSVGAFSAAVVAGVLNFRDALNLVNLRATLMKQTFPSGYGMGVIVGLSQQEVKRLLDKTHTNGEPVYIANINSPEQITIAGTITAIVIVLKAAREIGVRQAELLQVPVPSHCPLLEPISEKLGVAISNVSLNEPQMPYIANTSARLCYTAQEIRDDLVYSIAKPVQWNNMVRHLYERGTRLFIEMPPGHVLSSIIRISLPSVRSVAASEMELDSLRYLINNL